METLAGIPVLYVRQKKEWGEILTGFEGRNRYTVADEKGKELWLAREDGGNPLWRWYLQSLRPFRMELMDIQGNSFLRVNRPFRFFLSEAEVFDEMGACLGRIKQRFSLLTRRLRLFDAEGTLLCELEGPLLHPWTFRIMEKGVKTGLISKKWSGILKEGFTDADNFRIEFPSDCPPKQRCLLLGAVILIDFIYFERRK